MSSPELILAFSTSASGSSWIGRRFERRPIEASGRGLLFLVDLNNACFPRKWRTALVVLIPKTGKDPNLNGNLRTISLLSHKSKVFERLIQGVYEIIFTDNTFWSRSNSISKKVILRLLTDEASGDYYNRGRLLSGEETVALFLEVEQTFDRVWHDVLLHGLQEILLTDCYLHLIVSFLRNKTFRMRVVGVLPQEESITTSVTQESSLDLSFSRSKSTTCRDWWNTIVRVRRR